MRQLRSTFVEWSGIFELALCMLSRIIIDLIIKMITAAIVEQNQQASNRENNAER